MGGTKVSVDQDYPNLKPEAEKKLKEWLKEKEQNNVRYGHGSIQVFAEVAEIFYELGKEEK